MPKNEINRASVTAALGAWIGFLTGPNVMVSSTNSNFLRVLPQALGVPLATVSDALAVAVWLVAALVPATGWLMDRFGLRRVLVPGSVIFAGCFFLLSQVQTIEQFFAMQVVLAIGVACDSSVGYAKIVSLWFNRNRGKVLGLCVALGAGLGQTIMPKLSQAWIEAYGWRGGFIGIGTLILVLGTPLIFLLARTPRPEQIVADEVPEVEAPEPLGTTTMAETVEKAPVTPEGLTLSQAFRQPAFYKVFLAIMFGSMSLLGTLQHAVPMITERGLSVNVATTMASLSFAGVIFGQFSSGFLVDRFDTPRVILPYFVVAWFGLIIVHTAATPGLLFVGALMMGMGLGGEISQNAYLVSRYFGLKAFGSIYGFTFGASNLGIGVGLIVMGHVHDYAHGYWPMRYVFGTTMALSVLCVATLKPFVFAAPKRR